MKAIHFLLKGLAICGASESRRWPSSQITGTRSASAVTCKTCLRVMRAVVRYEAYAVFDAENSIIFPSVNGRRDGCERWAKRHLGLGYQSRGYRVEAVEVTLR